MNEIDLNELVIKTDNLPDTWKMLLIDPETGLPAQNMTVARFIEFLAIKMPVASYNGNGLMSMQDRIRYPAGVYRDRTYKSMHIAKVGSYSAAVIILAEASTETRPGGFGILQISGKAQSVDFTYTTLGSTHSTDSGGVLSTPIYVLKNSDNTYDVYAKNVQIQDPNGFGIVALATTTKMDIYQVDNIPIGAVAIPQQRFSFIQPALATSANILTDTILASPVPESRQVLGNLPANTSISNSSLDESTQPDNPDGSIPVKFEPNEAPEKYVWSIDKIGRAVLELQEENKRLKKILNLSDENEVQQM